MGPEGIQILSSNSSSGNRYVIIPFYSLVPILREIERSNIITDVAARGLDVDDIRMVVNFDFPNDTETCELLIFE